MIFRRHHGLQRIESTIKRTFEMFFSFRLGSCGLVLL